MKLDNVIIVLGKRLINNRLSVEGGSRVVALVNAFESLPMHRTALVFCGGKTQGQRVTEADAMFRYFQTLNRSLLDPFPQRHILLENRSTNTVQNMENAAEILCRSDLFYTSTSAHPPVNVTLLSNDYHLERILEIQCLMDAQGLLRVLKLRSAAMGLKLNVPLDIAKHVSAPYPHKGVLAEAFLLLDTLTTYRVYLEGVVSGAFTKEQLTVKAKPLRIAVRALEKLLALPLDNHTMKQIGEMKKAIEMTVSDNSLHSAKQALSKLHPLLTSLNQSVDPDVIPLPNEI